MDRVNWICRVLQCLLAWLLLVPPCVLIGIIPITLLSAHWFFVTQILRRILRPDLGSPLTKLDFLFSADDFHGKSRGAMHCVFTVEGELNLEKLQSQFQRIFSGSEASRKYERLTSLYPTHWLGYPFWTNTKQDFDIRRHLKAIGVAHAEEIQQVIEEWIMSPFAPEQPLVDMILIPGYKGNCGNLESVLAVRIHHMLCDGVSIISLTENESEAPISQTTAARNLSLRQKVTAKANALFWIPLVVAQQVYDMGIRSDFFSKRRGQKNEIYLTETTIGLDKMKKLRQHLSETIGSPVSISNVLLLAFGGALRKVLVNNLHTPTTDVEGMNNLSVNIAVPRLTPRLVQGVCNHWGISFWKIPIAEKDPLKRLEHLLRQQSWMRSTQTTDTNLILPYMSSILPRWVYRKLTNFCCGTTMGVSNIPGYSAPLYVTGNLVLRKTGIAGLQGENTSMTFQAHSYNGKLNISLLSNRDVFSRELNKKLMQEYFHEEADELLQSDFGLNKMPSQFV